MSKQSGITSLDYYHMWEIADHILVNEPLALPLLDWELANYNNIMIANDYTFDVDFKTIEMGKLVSGKSFKSKPYFL